MKTGIKILITMFATVAVCILLLVASASIPRNLIQKQSENSARYFAEREPFAVLYKDYINAIQDNYSDTLLCNIAYCMDTSHPFASAVHAKYVQAEGQEAYEGYLAAVSGKEEPNREYGRYWHGSLVLIRPLLMLIPIKAIRILCGLITVILQVIIAFVLIRQKKTALAVCWLVALLLVHPWMLFASLEYGTAFLTASAASIVLLLKRDKTDAGTMPFFVSVGIITCFVDFLTTETLTFLMPMMLLFTERILVSGSGREGKAAEIPLGKKTSSAEKRKYHRSEIDRRCIIDGCLSVLKNGLCWLGGYLGMFALKIGILALVAGEKVVRSSFSEGLFRIGGDVRVSNISDSEVVDFGKQLSGAVWHNLACLYPTHAGEMKAAGVWLITALIIAVGMVLSYLLHDKITWELFLPMGMIAVLPFIRFLVLSNHSYVHFFITYRVLMITICVFLFFVYENGIRHLIFRRGR
jgi:hypothetical protein